MEFREFMRWSPDCMPGTTDAVVVVSSCGSVIKRLPYIRWNKKNSNYSSMKEHIYKQSTNRGKQRFDDEEKIERHGLYRHVDISGRVFAVHRMVAFCFVDNPLGLECVNHIDGVRDNNDKSNLEWVSNKQNVEHAWSTGLRSRDRMKKISDDDMPRIIDMKKNGMSNPKIGSVFGVTGETIRVRIISYENSNGSSGQIKDC